MDHSALYGVAAGRGPLAALDVLVTAGVAAGSIAILAAISWCAAAADRRRDRERDFAAGPAKEGFVTLAGRDDGAEEEEELGAWREGLRPRGANVG